ncbi:TPA: hypothetical protein ACXNMZ_001999 [Yersinia enterocolitica]
MPATQEDRLYGLTTSVAVKPAVAISADYNITLFGEQTITSSTFTGERTTTTTAGMRVLAMGQANPADNGIWIASVATWARAPDFDGARDAMNGTLVFSIYGDCWQLEADDPVRIGYSDLVFRSTYPFSGEANLFQRSLRVPETSISILPQIDDRKNKILAFDELGSPIAVVPESGSAADVLIQLAKPSGAGLVGSESGTVQQVLNGKLKTSNHLSEIAQEGASAVSETLLNLGLGDAAKRAIGTAPANVPDIAIADARYKPIGYTPVLSKVWVSNEYMPVTGTPTIVNHGLTGIEALHCKADVLLKCIATDLAGYSPGDFAAGWGIHYNNAPLSPIPALSSSTITISSGNAGTGILVSGKGGGPSYAIDTTKWRFIFRIFY